MKDINQNSRILYDTIESNNQIISSKKPLRYMTDDVNKTRYLENPNMIDINTENNLRMKPTRLNEIFRDNVYITGNSPFKGLHDGPIDKESELFFGGINTNDSCIRRDFMEKDLNSYTFLDPFSLKTQTPLDTQYGTSTRTIYRNKCFKK